jgi:hypothetical protein
MKNGLGISVKVKIPKEIRAAAKGMPDMTRVGDRFAGAMEVFNSTAVVVAVIGATSIIAFALLWKGKK